MIDPTVLRDLEKHAHQADTHAEALEASAHPRAPRIAARLRRVAGDYRYLTTLAGICDELIAEAADTVPDRILAEAEEESP